MTPTPISTNVHPVIGSDYVIWFFDDGSQVRLKTTTLGSYMPEKPGLYMICSYSKLQMQPLYIGACPSLFGRLNHDLSWHPNLINMLAAGGHLVCYLALINFGRCRELQEHLLELLDPPLQFDWAHTRSGFRTG